MSDASLFDDLDAEAVMGQVVDDFLDRLQRGERPEVEDYVCRHPRLAAVLRQMLPALELVRVAPSNAGPTAGAVEPIQSEGPLGDFRLVRELGRGGMGVVYEAVQISLGRRVALKVLPFAAALDGRQLQRFKNEAQAAACLHHEHIVPVYGVGCERGVHFYAMQLIEGQSLAVLLAERRQQPDAATAQTPLPTRADSASRERRPAEFYRQAARLGIEAAEALAYAHEQGVIHRDVKPANLLLDAQGKLWVTDFGLAHVQGDVRLTMTGDLLGTLRYMAPEQALGQPALVGPRSDVYSLGVTLYELLTGRPAFPGADRQELLRQITTEDAIPPRRLDARLPGDLETVVLKAMARDPADRYATAQELADDLGRFLDDRPVRARRPTVLQRLGKWARRHRAVVRAAATGLAVAFGVLVASSLLLVRAYRAESRSRADAEAKLAMARKAINDWYTTVGWVWLNDEPEIEPVQIAYLLEAVKLYEALAREDARPRHRAPAGAAYVQLAEVRFRLGQADRAEADLRAALALLDPDQADPAERDAVRLGRAQALLALGHLPGDRQAAVDEATALFRALHEADPQDPQKGLELARAEVALGVTLFSRGRSQDAVRAFRAAEALLTRQVERNPADARAMGKLGVVLAYQAEEEARRSDRAAARRLLERATRHLADAVRLEPRFRGHRAAMQEKYALLARLAHEDGDVSAAVQASERAVAVAERLTEESPRLPRFRARLAVALHERGHYLRAAQRYAEARASYQRGRDLHRDLVRDFPAGGHEPGLAAGHADLGRLLAETRRPGQAVSAFRQAIRLARRSRRELAALHRDLGLALVLLKEPAAAEEHLTRGLDLSRSIAAGPDAVPEDRRVRMMATISLATLHLDGGRVPQARALFEDAAAQGEALVKQFSDTPTYVWGLVLARTGVRRCLALSGDGGAEALWQPTIDLLGRLVQLAPDDPTYRQELARQWEERAAELGRAGTTARAREALRRSLAARKATADRFPADPAHRLALAEAYLRAALGRRQYGLPDGRDEAGEIEDLVRQAITLLEGLAQQADDRRDAATGRAARRLLGQANNGLGTHLARGGAHAEALRRLGRAVDLYSPLADGDPRDLNLLSRLSGAHHDLGVTLGQVKRFADADAALREALDVRRRLLRLAPDPGKYDKALAQTHHGLAQTAEALGQHARAMEHGREALRLNPTHPMMNLHYAELLLDCPDEGQRDPARAAALARTAIAGGSNTPFARRVLAQALFRSSRWKEARDLFAAVARAQPMTADYFYLAMAEWHLNDQAAARQWLQRGEAAVNRHREALLKRRDQRAVRSLFAVEAEAKKLVAPAPAASGS